jgi:hypothetical protein
MSGDIGTEGGGQKPDLGVTVTAPEGSALETVLTKVRKRAGWINVV